MANISEILQESDWRILIEVDSNSGGDGTRIRVGGDSTSFRRLASVLSAMADVVEDKNHPSSDVGWHLVLNPMDLAALELENAEFLCLNCLPSGSA